MRHLLLALLLALLVAGLGPSRVLAEDPPEDEDEAAESEDGGWDAETFWFAKLLRPSEVMAAVSKRLQTVPRMQRRAAQTRMVEAYLAAWDETDVEEIEPSELIALYRLHQLVGEYEEALAVLEEVLEEEDLDEEVKDQAMSGLAALLANSRAHEELGEQVLEGLDTTLEAYLGERTGEDAGKVRGTIHGALARYADSKDDREDAIRHHMLSALEDPSKAYAVARTLVRSLMGSTHDLAGYEVLRATTGAWLPVLETLAKRHLASVKDGENARSLMYATRSVELIEKVGRPLEMLGRPVEAWTLDRAFGDVKAIEDVRGKVVILDFWATWCPWCIRSFPAMRELLRDYAPEDLAIVGVTTSASTVYEQRYDLDEDMKSKGGGERARPAAQLARAGQEPDAEKGVYAEAEYREREQKALEAFIQNHEMTWPVLMIDKAEPGPKYAVTGWPSALVLDRQGRVRYFKVGALLKDKPEAVAAFRAVLDDLIAEDGAETRPAAH